MKQNVVTIDTNHTKLLKWVEDIKKLCQPDKIQWYYGSENEFKLLCNQLVENGTLIPLSQKYRPNSYLARTDPRDVSRASRHTYICSKVKSDIGLGKNWIHPDEMEILINKLFDGCMKGRTMYIVPFCMGPLKSPFSRFGVEITDSPFVVVSLHLIARVGNEVLKELGENKWFLPCLHSVGFPLETGQKDVPWPCNPDNTHVVLFTEELSIISYGSNFGGNSFLSHRYFGIQIASILAKKEGWFAEHALILSLISPEGKKYYVVAAFPNGCGKTNLAMLVPTIPGWTVRCVGDDIAWMHVGEDGKLYAINPHNGFYDGISGVSYLTSRATMDLTQANTIFINVAMTLDGDVWWEGMTKESPSELIDWTGQKWTPNCGRKAAHPNARYVTPMHQCPVLDPEWENPNGIPICAIIFGGRRSNLFPLITEAFTWEHGVFLGSLVSSDNSIFSSETVREPFAMVPYCAYNINMYFEKWLQLNEQLGYNAPKFFFVNWFRTDEKGNYLWPGFSENSRILKWICQRIESTSVQVIKTPLGFIPSPSDLDLRSLDMNKEKIEKLFHFEVSEWKNEIIEIQKLYQKLGFEIPESLKNELKILMEKIL